MKILAGNMSHCGYLEHGFTIVPNKVPRVEVLRIFRKYNSHILLIIGITAEGHFIPAESLHMAVMCVCSYGYGQCLLSTCGQV